MSSTDRNKRYVCTKDDPWTEEKSDRAEHPDAKYIRSIDDDYGYYTVYKCPHCGLRFKVTGPSH